MIVYNNERLLAMTKFRAFILDIYFLPPNQKEKFETDDFFKKLTRESEVTMLFFLFLK